MRFDDILKDDETVGQINAKAMAKQAEIDAEKGMQYVDTLGDIDIFMDTFYTEQTMLAIDKVLDDAYNQKATETIREILNEEPQKVKWTLKFDDYQPNKNGRVYSPNVFDKAIKEFEEEQMHLKITINGKEITDTDIEAIDDDEEIIKHIDVTQFKERNEKNMEHLVERWSNQRHHLQVMKQNLQK